MSQPQAEVKTKSFWTEDILAKLDLTRPQLLNDSKTPSGQVHMGSPISPAIHHAVYLRLQQQGVPATMQFGFDDFDVVDGLSDDLLATHSDYFGVPLFQVPAPIGSQHANFADHYIADYQAILERLNIQPQFYRTSELYIQGRFNDQIKLALDQAAQIRHIYKTVSGSDKGHDWLPFQVICKNCGKLGTTRVTSWDGHQVQYTCEPNMVKWAQGCGHQGSLSPFDGNGKMPWRVEWAAKWAMFGVTFEAAGKDHASKGSSFDVCQHICTDVFQTPAPLNIGHEFILYQGKKMSSSKGIGIKGIEFSQALPTSLLRYYYIRTKPNLAIDAQPLDILTPRLFDDFDRLSAKVATEADPGATTLWQLSTQRPVDQAVARTIKFSTIAQWLQMPNVNIEDEATRQLGQLTEAETLLLQSRQKWAAYWLEHYASPDQKFAIQAQLPSLSLAIEQKQFLAQLADILAQSNTAEDFEAKLYEVAKQLQLPSKTAFQAIYQAFLHKDSGPKAAWLIYSLDKDFAIQRLQEAASS